MPWRYCYHVLTQPIMVSLPSAAVVWSGECTGFTATAVVICRCLKLGIGNAVTLKVSLTVPSYPSCVSSEGLQSLGIVKGEPMAVEPDTTEVYLSSARPLRLPANAKVFSLVD